MYEVRTGREVWRHRDRPESMAVLEKSGHIVARFPDHTFVSHLDSSGRWLREIPAFREGPFDTGSHAIGWNQSLLIVNPEDGRLRRVAACVSSIPPAVAENADRIVSICSPRTYSVVTGTAVATRSFSEPLAQSAAAVAIEDPGASAYLIDVFGQLYRVGLDDGQTQKLRNTGILNASSLMLADQGGGLLLGDNAHGMSVHDKRGNRLARFPRYFGSLGAFLTATEVVTLGDTAAVWAIPKELSAQAHLNNAPSGVGADAAGTRGSTAGATGKHIYLKGSSNGSGMSHRAMTLGGPNTAAAFDTVRFSRAGWNWQLVIRTAIRCWF